MYEEPPQLLQADPDEKWSVRKSDSWWKGLPPVPPKKQTLLRPNLHQSEHRLFHLFLILHSFQSGSFSFSSLSGRSGGFISTRNLKFPSVDEFAAHTAQGLEHGKKCWRRGCFIFWRIVCLDVFGLFYIGMWGFCVLELMMRVLERSSAYLSKRVYLKEDIVNNISRFF